MNPLHSEELMQEKAKSILSNATKEFLQCTSTESLYDLKVKYFGKQGKFSTLMKELGKVPKQDRPKLGKEVNLIKVDLEKSYNRRWAELETQELNAQLQSETLDLTLTGPKRDLGVQHPLSQTIDEIVAILSRIGFSVRTGPLIESDWFNFEALNIPQDHPARDMQDTFYIDDKHVLRTHTSPAQIHAMKNEKPPLRLLAPGSVFRCDAADMTHAPNFYQIEGLLIDKNVSMAHLKGTISYFVKAYFGPEIKTRFRPSFFPFTEPSAEVDCSCPVCKGKGCQTCSHTGWIEIGGSGLVHPNVIKITGLDPAEWQGYAFGFGIERMAMIKYRINDIRLFNENNVQFLSQFK